MWGAQVSRKDATFLDNLEMRSFSGYQRVPSDAPENAESSKNGDVDVSSQFEEYLPEFDDPHKDEGTTKLLSGNTLELGVPGSEKRFWFQRSKTFYDEAAIATQPSVYDDPETAEEYRPPLEWENYHRFDPRERWTWGEEHRLIRKIDAHIMLFAALMFMALELDRSNISQALTDNLLDDLGMTTNGK
jgi:hypothetical protein